MPLTNYVHNSNVTLGVSEFVFICVARLQENLHIHRLHFCQKMCNDRLHSSFFADDHDFPVMFGVYVTACSWNV